MIRTVLGFELEDEAEILESLFKLIEEKPIVGVDLKLGNSPIDDSLFMIYHILKQSYPDKNWADQIKSLISEDKWTIFTDIYGQNKRVDVTETVSKYLESMNVKFELDTLRDGIAVPIYLPAQKLLVYIYPKFMMNFDKFTFGGKGAMIMRLYKGFLTEEEKFSYISISDFFKQPDNMSKINYLISQGIENENLTGTFDFSSMPEEFQEDAEPSLDKIGLEVGLEEDTPALSDDLDSSLDAMEPLGDLAPELELKDDTDMVDESRPIM